MWPFGSSTDEIKKARDDVYGKLDKLKKVGNKKKKGWFDNWFDKETRQVNSARETIDKKLGDTKGNFMSGRDDPQLGFMWDIGFRGLGDATASAFLKFNALSTALPSTTIEPIKRRFAGKEYAVGGRSNSPKSLRVTFWDDSNLTMFKYFNMWMQLVSDETSGTKTDPSIYMREVSVDMLDSTGKESNMKMLYDQAFPIEMDDVPLSYESSSLFTFDVVFQFNTRKMVG